MSADLDELLAEAGEGLDALLDEVRERQREALEELLGEPLEVEE